DGRRMQIVHPQTARQHHQQAHVHDGGKPTSHRVAYEFTSKRGGEPSRSVLVSIAARAQARSSWVVDSPPAGFGSHRLHPQHAMPVYGVVLSVGQPPATRRQAEGSFLRGIPHGQDNVYYFFEGDNMDKRIPCVTNGAHQTGVLNVMSACRVVKTWPL